MNTYPKKLNSTDIARLAGVSQATVSRVLSGRDKVKEATRLRVLKVINESGYSPNPFAQAMRTSQSRTVGVAVSRITNPIVPEILEALAQNFTAFKRRLLVWNTDSEGEDGLIQAIRSGTIDGVIFTAASHQTKAIKVALEAQKPVVSFNRYLEGAACDQIVSSNFDGAAQIARYLVAQGRQRIGFINGPLDRTTLADREAGFRHALAVSGRDIPPQLYAQSDFEPEAFRQAAIDMMASDTPPDAIACGNDLIAIGTLNGLRSIGAKVPEDVWVTGFDGIEMTGWDVIDLTTMRQPIDVMAADAARALIDRIEGRYIQPKVVEYPTEFIVRGSTTHAAQ
ncbi:LacI family DNA-binding transcriptional regulator [Yoonia sp.]|uniref:LacI family DNA-binding transcriptional regulator n=1 Tax=Yoonia sp. TaxID=2212373 RepID=UPI003F6C9037